MHQFSAPGFNPPGFNTLGPQGQHTSGGISLTIEHDPVCPFVVTDIPLPPLDISMYQDDSTLRRRLRQIFTSAAESSGCSCGIDIPPTPALRAILNRSTAPRQALPITLKSTIPWPSTLEETDDMNVDYGGLEASRHAQTQLPAPAIDTQSQAITGTQNSRVATPPARVDSPRRHSPRTNSPAVALPRAATPVVLRPTPQRQSRAPTPQRAPTPVAYAPPTPNTANLLSSTRLQTVEDLLAHINQIVASTNANVHTVLNKCIYLDNSYTGIVNRFERLFEAQDNKFESLEKKLAFLRDQNRELKDKLLNLPQSKPAAPTRPTIPLPQKPAPSRKGKEIAAPSPSPAPAPWAPAPTPTRPTAPTKPHPHRAPAPTPQEETTSSDSDIPAVTTRRATRKAAEGPKKYVAPAPTQTDDDEEEEISSPAPAPTPPSWATVTSKRANKALKNEVPVKPKKAPTAPTPAPPRRGPKAPSSTPPTRRDGRLIVVRANKYKKEKVNRALLPNCINTRLARAGVDSKSGIIAHIKLSNTNNIVLETDGDHSANTMWPYLSLVEKGVRDAIDYEFDIVKDLERTLILISGIPLNYHHPRTPAKSWSPSDWDIQGLENCRAELQRCNTGLIALDRPRAVGTFAGLKGKKATTVALIFGVEKNDAATALIRSGRINFAGIQRSCREWTPDLYKAYCERCLSPHHVRGMCMNPPVCKYCWGEHESPKHKCPVVGCQITGSCIKHGIRQCYNCEGHSHFAGAPKCPARGIEKEVDADNETQALENRTTSGTHQNRPHESRRGMRAVREKKPAIVVTDTDDTRPSTPPARTSRATPTLPHRQTHHPASTGNPEPTSSPQGATKTIDWDH